MYRLGGSQEGAIADQRELLSQMHMQLPQEGRTCTEDEGEQQEKRVNVK